MVNIQMIDKVYQFIDQGFIFKLVDDRVRVSTCQEVSEQQKASVIDFVVEHTKYLQTLLSINNNLLSSMAVIIKQYSDRAQLSFAQERLWFIDQLEEGTEVYNIPLVFELPTDVNLNCLEQSLSSVISRHEVLRTFIKKDEDGAGYQQVITLEAEPFILRYYKIDSETELKANLDQEYAHIFKLDSEYPIRAMLYSTKKNKHYLSLLIHHIAFDGWSTEVLVNELQTFYRYYLNQLSNPNFELELPELPVQYKDYSLWQRAHLNKEREATQLNYWKEQLANFSPLNLLADKPRPSRIDYSGANIFFELDLITSNKLRELAKSCGVGLYSVLLSAYYLMLRAYSHQDDVIVGTAVANRHYDQVENLIGLFVNSLALRVNINSQMSIIEFIKYVGKKIMEAQLHQDLPFEKLVEELKLPKDTSRHPIFQVVFGMQNHFGQQDILPDQQLILKPYTDIMDRNTAKYDLSTYVDDRLPKLSGFVNYATSLYSAKTVESFAHTYKLLLTQLSQYVGSNDEQTLADLQYLDTQQYKQVIYQWNDTRKKYPINKTIHQVFEEQVVQTPDNIAVICGDLRLTYKELNERANRLAHYLIKNHKIKPNDFIALCVNRDEEAIVAILAILKVGAAYVPINPSQPDDRIGYILEDTQAKVILAHKCYKNKLKSIVKILNFKASPAQIFVDDYNIDSKHNKNFNLNPKSICQGSDLAYVIYTSGTTGTPKGVMVEHNACLNYIYNLIDYVYGHSGKLNIDFSTNLAFDLSVSTTLGTLLSGNRICIYSDDNLDVDAYIEHLITNKVDIIKHVPSYFELIIDNLSENDLKKLSLSSAILGGEKLPKPLLQKTLNKLPIKVYEEYGPTETIVGSHISMIDNLELIPSHNLGRPYFNYTTYILDANQQPLPIGAIGELYIGGNGIARGYLNQPTTTAQKFVTNPFQNEEDIVLKYNQILYKTGDLVRYTHDGTLEYFNRNDTQIKINGYRIELEEIESILSSYIGITQSVVLVRKVQHNSESSDMEALVGYYVSVTKLDETQIITYLKARLPEYMLPKFLVYVPNLSLTINGKLDQNALPDPELSVTDNYVAPRGDVEIQLVQIWSEMLRVDEGKIGIDDNFFRLGGNSILAIKLVSQINKKLQSNLKLVSIFSNNSIRNMKRLLKVGVIVDEGEI